jgi:hypothetical protein
MIRLTLTRDRQFGLTLDRPSGRTNVRPGNYRFARASVRGYFRRGFDGARALFGAMLKLIAAAKLRRIERELRISGPHHDWLRIDDDHFTPIEH